MGALVATDVTVTLSLQDMDYTAQGGVRSFPSMIFGNGVKTYPALGIPLPDLKKFGMKKRIKRAYIENPANGYVYHFDRANHKLRIFQSAGFTPEGTVSAETAGTPAGTVAAPLINIAGDTAGTVPIGINADADGASLSKTSAGNKTGITGIQAPPFSGTEMDTHTHTFTGAAVAAAPLVEVPTTHAPAETIIYLEVVGQ